MVLKVKFSMDYCRRSKHHILSYNDYHYMEEEQNLRTSIINGFFQEDKPRRMVLEFFHKLFTREYGTYNGPQLHTAFLIID